MLARNEWDPLKHVIVGRADGSCIPTMDTSLRTINYSHLGDVSDVPCGLYPQQVIDEANEDLEGICDFFTSMNIKVDRPVVDSVPGYYYYCPRDSICIFDDLVLETPMPLRARKNETQAFRHVFENLDDDFRWVKLNAKRDDKLYNLDCVGDPNVLALQEIEPAFDAANIIRANDDIFYLVSNSANKRGSQVLQNLLGPKYRVWTIENIYSYMHIDSTICFLREGLMLLNPERIKDKNVLPKPLQSWDVIWAPEPGDVWHYPGYCNSSRWAAMNIFSVTPNLALVEKSQVELARRLEKHGIDVNLMSMRHGRTLGGSFHCVTLDLKREHK
jgi:glycine amidinotransferase/scyllo-inosamine-4-phosphate amidinotransferase 1